jgi:hypothetical protein
LGDLYDIQDPQTAARTLDFLSQLDSTIASGDQDSVNALYEQIKSGGEIADKTLSELEKLNISMDANKSHLQIIADNAIKAADANAIALRMIGIMVPDAFIESGAAKKIDADINPAGFSEGINKIGEKIEGILKSESPQEELMNFLKGMFEIKNKEPNNILDRDLENPVVKAINMLSDNIGKVLERLELTERELSKLRR